MNITRACASRFNVNLNWHCTFNGVFFLKKKWITFSHCIFCVVFYLDLQIKRKNSSKKKNCNKLLVHLEFVCGKQSGKLLFTDENNDQLNKVSPIPQCTSSSLKVISKLPVVFYSLLLTWSLNTDLYRWLCMYDCNDILLWCTYISLHSFFNINSENWENLFCTNFYALTTLLRSNFARRKKNDNNPDREQMRENKNGF